MTKTATKRAPNFSSKEENLLVTLAAKYKAKIECKRTDASSNVNKNKAWEKIAEEFNIAVVDGSRDAAVLKNKFENLKKRTKKKFSEEKCFVRGTGGGPGKKINITEEDNIIKSIISTQVTGRPSEFDGDNTIVLDGPDYSMNGSIEEQEMHFMASLEQDDGDVSVEVFENEIIDLDSSQAGPSSRNSFQCEPQNTDSKHYGPEKKIVSIPKGSVHDWTKGTPIKLRTPISSTLRTNTRIQNSAILKNKLTDWITAKTELSDLSKQFMIEEHESRMTAIGVEHSAKMEEQAVRMQYMKEEHMLKLKLMQQAITLKFK